MSVRSISDIAKELNATGLTQQQSALLIELVLAKGAQEKHLPTSALLETWVPNPGHYMLAFKKYNKGIDWVDRIADEMRDWAKSKGEKRASWDGTFRTFMCKAREREIPRTNGFATQRLGRG